MAVLTTSVSFSIIKNRGRKDPENVEEMVLTFYGNTVKMKKPSVERETQNRGSQPRTADCVRPLAKKVLTHLTLPVRWVRKGL